jgi:hypothetical protein
LAISHKNSFCVAENNNREPRYGINRKATAYENGEGL